MLEVTVLEAIVFGVKSVRSRDRERDCGSAAIVVLVCAVVVGAALMSALGEVGSTVRHRSQAQTAADAAALASLDGGRSAAASLASANGARLVSWAPGPGTGEVTVMVRVDDITATARATNTP
jgi:Putative Flp pilus-assembly TadE/G-like